MSNKSDARGRWNIMSAFGDHKKYKKASKENAKPSPEIKQNNHTGVIGKAGNIAFNNKKFKLHHKEN